jgi:hypothetical protein
MQFQILTLSYHYNLVYHVEFYLFQKHSRCSSRSSSISISIESALGAFDFLNTEDENGEPENHQ